MANVISKIWIINHFWCNGNPGTDTTFSGICFGWGHGASGRKPRGVSLLSREFHAVHRHFGEKWKTFRPSPVSLFPGFPGFVENLRRSGAHPATDVTLRAEVLSYSRNRGLFAGLSLEGSTTRPDNGANEKLYGKQVEAEDIVRKGAVAVPPSGQELIGLLNKKSPKNLSDPNSLKE